MPNSVKELLYTNASFMKALDTSLSSKTKTISFDGKKWIVGGVEVSCSPDKLSYSRSFFSKLSHKLHAFFSPNYSKRLQNNVKLFETAFTTCEKQKEKQRVSAIKAHKKMVGISKAEEELRKLEGELKTVTEKKTSTETTVSPSVKKANDELIGTIEQLVANQNAQEKIQYELDQIKESAGHKISSFFNIASEEHSSLQAELKDLQQQKKTLEDAKERLQAELNQLTQTQQTQVDALRLKETALKKQIADLQEKFDKDTGKTLPDVEAKETLEALSDAPVSVEKTVSKFTFNKPLQTFLDTLEKKGSRELRQLFEGMLTNISQKMGQNIVKDFSLNPDGSYTLTFDKTVYFWLPALDDAGKVDTDANNSAIFTFGNASRQLNFTLEPNLFKVIEGWDVKARLPANLNFLTGFPLYVSKWPDAQIFRISTTPAKIGITGGKTVAGVLREKETTRPIAQAIENWSTRGEIVAPDSKNISKSLEAFFKAKIK